MYELIACNTENQSQAHLKSGSKTLLRTTRKHVARAQEHATKTQKLAANTLQESRNTLRRCVHTHNKLWVPLKTMRAAPKPSLVTKNRGKLQKYTREAKKQHFSTPSIKLCEYPPDLLLGPLGPKAGGRGGRLWTKSFTFLYELTNIRLPFLPFKYFNLTQNLTNH